MLRENDLVTPAALIVVAAAVLAILVLMGSPVLFAQERVGSNGRVFKMFKLRSWHARAGAGLLSMFLFAGVADLAPASAIGQQAPVTTGISADNGVATRKAHAVLGKLPLHFEINGGQAPAGVDFVARGHGYAAFLTREGPVLAVAHAVALPTALGADRQPPKMERAVVALELIGANPAATATGIEPLSGVVNYYIGHQQMTGNRTYAKVRYQGIYPGIDLVYYGNQRQLEYDFVVHPGADPSVIRLGIQGADSARVDDAGDLVLMMGDREMRQHRLLVYQDGDAGRQEVAGRYVQDGGETRFELGAYDTSRTLTIDPTLSYSTFLGGDGEDNAWGIAVDPAGNIYVSGVSNSLTQGSATGHSPVVPYPLKNAYQAMCCHGEDTGPAVVTKLDPTGKTLIYSTYFGGVAGTDGKASPCPTPPDCGGAAYYARGWDVSYGITADSQGNAYVTGQAESLFFPTTPTALRKSHPGPSYAQFKATTPGFYRDHPRDAYLAKFGPTGTLLYSTLIGGHGSDSGNSVAVIETGPSQGIYVAGIAQSVDFFGPGIPGATPMPAVNTYQKQLNVAPCTNLAGGPTLTGCSKASTPPASCHDAATGANNWACWRDGFVMRFDFANPATVLLSTLLGSGGDDGIYGISVDAAGNIYVSGETEATDFPITANAYQQCHNGNGGYPSDPTLQTPGMAPFACHLSPTPSTADYPIQSKKPYNDAHVTKIAPNGALLYSTYLGGTQDDASGAPSGNFTGGQGKAITIDAAGIAYVTGFTESSTPASAAAHCGAADPNTGQGTKPCPTQVPFPTTSTAYKQDLKTDPLVPATKRASHSNTWLAKIDTTKSGVVSLLYSTYLGGIGDEEAFAVATDNTGGAYVVGNTDSWDFPLRKPLPGQQFINGNLSTTTKTPQFADAFVYKIDTTKAGDLSLVYSTYLGGSADEEARGVVYVQRPGFTGVYVTGFTASDGRPHLDAPGYPGSHSCDPKTGAPTQDGDPATGLCPGQIVAFKTTPDAFQKTIAVSRKKECTNLNVPDCNTPLPADPNEDTFIVKIADLP